MTSTARQLRQPPAIEAIERVPYFPNRVVGLRKRARTYSYAYRGFYIGTSLIFLDLGLIYFFFL